MNQTERFYKIDLLLNERKVVSFTDLQEALQVSPATLKRDLAYLRDRLNAPIVYDRDRGGYRFEGPAAAGDAYELPGLWFSADEIHALLTMQQLLANLDTGGLLGPHIQPLMTRLEALIGAGDHSAAEVARRVKVLSVGARRFQLAHFQAVGSALLGRRRLLIDYSARSTDQTTRREISPQRLVHYRGNWYLDAWCHHRDDLRSFAVDAMARVELLDTPAQEMSEADLDARLGAGYGIFSGAAVKWAKLRFSPDRTRWVAAEVWHPGQIGAYTADGAYELQVPYSDDPELIMDILKFGADCRVVAPPELVARVRSALSLAAAAYEQASD